ncbi:MAG: endopeptidase La [Planctomycetes bacterium]|nr:endopeptidase La [Planctomycetota bacterium]
MNDDRSDPDDHPEHDAEIVEGHETLPPASQVARPDENLPTTVLALPLNQRPVFPTMMLPLVVPAGRLADTVKLAIAEHGGWVAFFLTRTTMAESTAYTFADLHRLGALARVLKHQEVEGGAVQIFAQIVARFRSDELIAAEPHVLVRGAAIKPRVDASDPHVRACAMAIVQALKDLVQHNPVFADEIKMVLANFNNIDGPGRLADLSTSLTTASREEVQQILETTAIVPRMEKVLLLLHKETQLAEIKAKITHQIEEKVSDHQRKFFLNEQLKAIKSELGLESDDKSLDLKRFRDVLEAKGKDMTEEARSVIDEELRKLSLLEAASSEYGVVRTRLEWLSEMPWGAFTEDDLDLQRLRAGLDKDHFGLDEVKERIVEFCAVRRLKNDRGGGIIALVGPPGTGKTSIGQSVARQLGRKFFRLSLGGMRDEAEIRGHRRTYVGAQPGKLVQALRRAKTFNPVILLDEIDKLSIGMQGDPASALLEVLDPEQNRDFLDHYLDIRVDLSRVLFICTANDLGGIPEPLRDRMEIIRLAGYVESEKLAIARNYLVPKQRADHGLKPADLQFTRPALTTLIRGYAREAGVRHLEQLLAKVCRKVATAKAGGAHPGKVGVGTNPGAGAPPLPKKPPKAPDGSARVIIAPETLTTYLGKPLMRDDELLARAVPGVVTGLAWTSMGGATLEIEAVATPSEKGGGLTLTGQLGDVMKESATLARSYLTSHGEQYGLSAGWFDRHAVHVHVPAGATPKDGPSAGCAIATALMSLALGKPVKRKLGMTGELTLTGRVYPIGGVREKLVAAKRSNLRTVLLPRANERDYDELPDQVRSGFTVIFVDTLDDVVREAGLIDAPKDGARGKAAGSPAGEILARPRPRS